MAGYAVALAVLMGCSVTEASTVVALREMVQSVAPPPPPAPEWHCGAEATRFIARWEVGSEAQYTRT
jgi:hypothetical protein